jgi:hypothetical protein
MADKAIAKAAEYDCDIVYQTYWRPFLASLEQTNELRSGLDPIPETGGVAVVVPAMKRPQNVDRLVSSLKKTAPDLKAYFICDPDDEEEIEAVTSAGANVIISTRGHTYAQKVNVAYENTHEPWVFVCGDDVEFHPGWVDEARKVSDRFDVIGTNDTAGMVRNGDVANGSHADHFFIRRAYIDEHGSCLDGPGVAAPEAYKHWWVDKEIVGLAKARGVFTPCLSSIVEHHHPGYQATPTDQLDDVYHLAISSAAEDRTTFLSRAPLIQMQRTTRGKS